MTGRQHEKINYSRRLSRLGSVGRVRGSSPESRGTSGLGRCRTQKCQRSRGPRRIGRHPRPLLAPKGARVLQHSRGQIRARNKGLPLRFRLGNRGPSPALLVVTPRMILQGMCQQGIDPGPGLGGSGERCLISGEGWASTVPNICATRTMVPKGGLEPPQAYAHMTLNHARLPVPPLRQHVVSIHL